VFFAICSVAEFHGGPHENTEITDLAVYYSFLAQIHRQIKDFPDGTKVKLIVRN